MQPNILRAKEETLEIIMGDSQRAHEVVAAFFSEYDSLFKKQIGLLCAPISA
jgi:hypothetical protein